MSFDTLEFARFLPVVLLGYYFLPFRAQNVWLLGASYVFYASWAAAFVLLLLFSTLLDYGCAWAIEIASSSRRRRRFLLLSLVGNLGVLATFKYLGFFVDSAMGLLERVGLDVSRPVLEIALPVGISFYTFQTMAYTIDVYRGHQRASRNLLDFALYVSFFPQLVAGPIERARSLLPQIATPRVVTNRHLREGAFLVLWGLFKKIGLSNAMAPMVDAAYGPAGGASMSELWRALYLFAFQVYFDFSGYSDIARGCARLLGVELMENFHQPFLARNLADFWRRWHVSFSTWLRDYVYVPLGGSRGGAGATSRNLVITLAICAVSGVILGALAARRG